MMPGEQARDTGLTLKEETKTQMLECIDISKDEPLSEIPRHRRQMMAAGIDLK